jgi:putative ABC transport system permease protein
MEALSRNLRLSIRQIRRQPGFAAAVVLTLALAIGANTAIFSFVNALLIRPFPFREADQLVEIRSMRGGQPGRLSIREILDIQQQATSIEAIAAHTNSAGGYNFSGEGRPEEWKTILTTGNLFDVLGAPLALGGTWPQPLDRTRDARVVLTYGVWQRRFGGRRDIIGKSITLDHMTGYIIQGVTAEGFDFPRGVEIYRSIGGFANYERRDSRNVVGIARIRRRYSVERLQAELDAVSHRLSTDYPDTNAGLSFRATTFRNIYAGDARPYLVVPLCAVGFVLLIACSNVVNLLLSRALSREREMAVRIAMGAGRSAILGQLLTESIVLSFAAAGLGLALAYWWMKLLRAIIGAELPGWMVIEIDARVLAFTAGIAVLAGIISGLAPALQVSRGSLTESLKEAGRGNSGGRLAGRLRDWLIVAEVALAVVLLAGAGIMIRGFGSLLTQDKGFRAESIQTFRVALGVHYAAQDAKVQYYERAQREIAAIPGVQGVAFIYNPPLSRLDAVPPPVQTEGQSAAEALHNPYVNLEMVSDNYFELMKIPLKAGRFFTAFDRPGTELVAIVSERLAKLLWPGQDPLGKRLMYNPASGRNPYYKVVGVAGNVQLLEMGGEPGLEMYLSYRQRCDSNEYMLVKTALAPREFERRVQQIMWGIDTEQSVFDFQSYEQRILDSIWQLRISRVLLIVFGGVALVLAAIGIYGIMSYLVGQRTREMGIRLALGATPAEVRLLIVRRGAILGITGAAMGLLAAAGLGKAIEHNLRYISGGDPVSFAVPFTVLLIVTVGACAAPAWRASRVDPAVTLRQE